MGTETTTDHVAFVTGDTGATVDFYTRVLRWPLVGAHRGTEPDGRAFFMTAFAADGYRIEFEEVEGRPAPPPPAAGFPHFGIAVGSAADYGEWKAHLERCEVVYLEMTPGDLYITDPNGVSFQLFVASSDGRTDDERAATARRMVEAWVSERRAAVPAAASGSGVRTRISGPVIGCGDAWALADFYAALLGWDVVDRSDAEPGGWALVRSPNRRQKLEFQREDPFVPPVWPTVAGEQQMGMHLDIAVEGLAPMAEMPTRRAQFFEVVDRAVAMGAHVAEHQPQEGRVVVMVDPAGHPFCLFPGNV